MRRRGDRKPLRQRRDNLAQPLEPLGRQLQPRPVGAGQRCVPSRLRYEQREHAAKTLRVLRGHHCRLRYRRHAVILSTKRTKRKAYVIASPGTATRQADTEPSRPATANPALELK